MTSTGGTGAASPRGDLQGPNEIADEQMLTLGEVQTWRRPPRDSPTPRAPKVGAAIEAIIAAGVGLLVLPGLGQLQRQLLMRLDVVWLVVGVVLSTAAAFAVAGAMHRWLGGGRRRDAAAVGAVAAALAGTAWGAITIAGGWELWQYLPPRTVMWATAVGAVVLAVRVDGVGGRLAGALAGAMTAAAVVSAVQSGWPILASYLPPPAQPSAPPVVEETADAAPSAQPEPGEDLASPTLGTLCHPDELAVDTTTPVPGGHDVATTLTATNTGGRDCRVEGWPTVHLLSDGEDLALNGHVSKTQPGGDHVDPVDVWLAPGESARTQVWWPSWGAAADLDAEQQLRVGVGGGLEIVELARPDRWDVVRSAEFWVAPWQPEE